LDNKSVFFDVTGFNYFLLVYTPPQKEKLSASQEDTPPRHHITGFFSKEKMSWDNNNLACILVFPPWQRKGLGSLLMGVSYEISRREGILGGPEKPISELGKKGYKRFWAGQVARWILGLETSEDKETVVDVDDCSNSTWIVPEDCLAVLRDMAVVQDAGKGPGRPMAAEGEEKADAVKEVNRVKVDKEVVRRWVEVNGINLDRACDPDAFVEGYALRPSETAREDS
jgi:GNAT superfamily N-acetyltransferase